MAEPGENEEEKEEEEAEEQFKEKGKEQGKKAAKKGGELLKKGGEKIVKFLAEHKELWKYLLIALAVIIAVVILIVGFMWLLKIIEDREINDSLNGAFTATIPVAGAPAPTEPTTKQITVDKDASGKYIINTEFTDEEIEAFKQELIVNHLDPDEFSVFELKFIAALVDNGLQLHRFSEEELKCIPNFFRAEQATQHLDLRTVDEMYPDGTTYTPTDPSIYEQEENHNKINGIITVQRLSTEGTRTNLTYIDYATFDAMRQAGNEEVLKNFTLNEYDDLVIAKWSYNETTYGYTGDVLEEEKQTGQGGMYILSPTSIPYKDYVAKYTMPFELLTAFLAILNDSSDFCKDLTNLAFNSKIVIAVEEELTITETTKQNQYTINQRIFDRVNYKIKPNNIFTLLPDPSSLSDNNGMIIELLEEEGVKFTEKIGPREYIETVTTIDKTNTYQIEIIEADIWYAKYTKTYSQQAEQTTPETLPTTQDLDEYAIKTIENIVNPSTDIHVPPFEISTAQTYINNNPGLPKGYWATDSYELEGVTYNYAVAIIDVSSWLGINLNNLSNVKINNTVATSEDMYIDHDTRSILIALTGNFGSNFTVSFTEAGRIWSFNTTNTNSTTTGMESFKNLYLNINCFVTHLDVETQEKTDITTDTSKLTTKYPTDPNPITTKELNVTKDQKFLKIYDENPETRYSMRSVGDWVFTVLEERAETIDIVPILKGLLTKYDGADYGLTEEEINHLLDDFDGAQIMEITNSSTGFWWPIAGSDIIEQDGKQFDSGTTPPIANSISSMFGEDRGDHLHSRSRFSTFFITRLLYYCCC